MPPFDAAPASVRPRDPAPGIRAQPLIARLLLPYPSGPRLRPGRRVRSHRRYARLRSRISRSLALVDVVESGPVPN